MAPISLKLQCLELAKGDVPAARAMLDWLMEPLAEGEAEKLSLTQPASVPGSQPPVPPVGTARR
jgi:hypothetical protein